MYSGVILDSAGSLYGTAASCGSDGDGMSLYTRLTPSGSKYGFGVIFAFDGTNGSFPYEKFGHLEVDSAGDIFGTAGHGGPNGDCECGTVFKLSAGSFFYTDLHVFGEGTDGAFPQGGVSVALAATSTGLPLKAVAGMGGTAQFGRL